MSLGIPAPEPIVAVRDVLPGLGFVEDWNSMTDCRPGFKFQCGNLDITANQVTSFYLRPEFSFGGLGKTARSLHFIEFSMPLRVESTEQVVAWIVHGIGIDFVPSHPIAWFEDGKRWQHLLPWKQHWLRLEKAAEEHRQLRLARPHCQVSREWMRMLKKHVRGVAATAAEQDEFVVEFDGRMFKIALSGAVIGAPASGTAPWSRGYRGRLATLSNGLPTRLMTDPVEVGIWEGQLEIERSRIDVVPASSALPAKVAP